MLKRLMIGAAFAALAASPTLAQSFDPSVGSGNIVGPANAPVSGPTMPAYTTNGQIVGGEPGYGAYAYAPARRHRAMELQ